MSVISDILRGRVGGGERSSILRHAVGIACELLTIRDPYADESVVPHIIAESTDGNNFPVRAVAANNHTEVNRFSGNVPGGRVVHTKIGKRKWLIHVEKQ